LEATYIARENLVYIGSSTNSSYQPGSSTPKTASIDQRIEKLKERQREIKEDLAKRSTNPDPKAAQGENNANAAVNQRILQQLENQIRMLEQQRDNSSRKSDSATPDYPQNGTRTQLQSGVNTIDIIA
jgi:hypothetical protein